MQPSSLTTSHKVREMAGCARNGGLHAHRPGALMLELAPVSPESANSMGSRSYIWDKKQTFMLSPMELGGLIEAVTNKRPMKELFHDPGKGRPGWGSPPSTHCVIVRSEPRLGLQIHSMRESNSEY